MSEVLALACYAAEQVASGALTLFEAAIWVAEELVRIRQELPLPTIDV